MIYFSKMILSVDTLDYTKGLLQRITAFEKLLEKYHIHREKVVLVQVCVQSRHEDGETLLQQLQARVETLNRSELAKGSIFLYFDNKKIYFLGTHY